MVQFPAFHYELLNDIHAQRAGRKIVAPHHFSNQELDRISKSVGDNPTWDRELQPQLVKDTLAKMASLYPHVEED